MIALEPIEQKPDNSVKAESTINEILDEQSALILALKKIISNFSDEIVSDQNQKTEEDTILDNND